MTLFIGTDLWRAATESLHQRPHDRERVAFLDGPRPGEGGPSVATTLVLPDFECSAGNYRIPTQAMSRAGRHLRELEMLRLAQIHSHPFGWTGHSDHDDEFAFSHRDGAISIVVAFYAACAPGVRDCGVHICRDGKWVQVPGDEINEVVRVIPSRMDFRT